MLQCSDAIRSNRILPCAQGQVGGRCPYGTVDALSADTRSDKHLHGDGEALLAKCAVLIECPCSIVAYGAWPFISLFQLCWTIMSSKSIFGIPSVLKPYIHACGRKQDFLIAASWLFLSYVHCKVWYS